MTANGKRIAQLLAALVGKRIWHVNAGGSAGSTFSLALGANVPRETALDNPDVSPRFRNFRGEYGLYVWCTSRFVGANCLASSDQDHQVFAKTLHLLTDSVISAARIHGPLHDLRLETTAGVLDVFCDHVPPDMSFDGNWELTFPGGSLNIGPGHLSEIKA